jgi:DEK C terminal domain
METQIRKAVAKTVRKADLNTVSAKQIRKSVENELALKEGELSSERWKSVVKEVIEQTMAAITRDGPAEELSEREEDARMILHRFG